MEPIARLRDACDAIARRYDIVIPLTTLVVGYLTMLVFVPLKTDSGVFVYAGQTLLRGGSPYLDFWDHKGPLLYLFNLFGLALGGGSIRGVILLEGLLVGVATLWSLLAWSRLVARAAVALVGSAFVISYFATFESGNLSETWLAPFALVAYSAVARSLSENRLGRAAFVWAGAALGAAGGIATLTRPNNGIGLFVAALALVALARGSRRWTAAAVTAAGLLVVVPVLAWVALHGAIPAMLEQYVQFNLYYSAETVVLADRIKSVADLLARLIATPAMLSLVAVGVLTTLGGRHPARSQTALGVLAAAAIADLVSTMLGGRGHAHYLVTTLPSLAVLTILLATTVKGLPQHPAAPDARHMIRRPGLYVLLAIFLLASAPAAVEAGGWLMSGAARTTGTLNRVGEAIAGADSVLLYGSETSILAAAGIGNAAPMTSIWIMLHRDARGAERARTYTESAIAAEPSLILRSPRTCPLVATTCDETRSTESEAIRLGVLRTWIIENYAVDRVVDGYEVWTRR
jgi:hypothetical protein